MYLLDTSALAAHCFSEPGGEIVDELLLNRSAWIAAPTWLELRIRLSQYAGGETQLAAYRSALAGIVDITASVADMAFLIRRATPQRLPAVDALVAAAAKVQGFRLVHRDKHLATIPQEVLPQTILPAR